MLKYILLLLTSITLSFGQIADGASLGLAGNYTAHSRGVDAISWNPANLSMYRTHNFELNLIGLQATLSSGLSIANYNQYFTQEGHSGRWSTKDKKDILNLFSNNNMSTHIEVNSHILSFVSGNMGFSIQLMGKGHNVFNSREALEVFLFGETLTQDYKFSQNNILKGHTFTALKNTLAWSHLFKFDRRKHFFSHLSVGVGANFYAGLAVAQISKAHVSLVRETTQENDVRAISTAALQARAAAAGQNGLAGYGLGLDFGVTARFKRSWHVSLAFSNLFSNINWNGDPRIYEYSRSDTLINSNNNGSNNFVRDSDKATTQFSTALPQTMRLGLRFRFLHNLTFTADYHQGINSAFGNTTTPRFGAGAEYKVFNWLPLRAGVAVGGHEKFVLASGVGIKLYFIQLDLSYGMHKAVLPIYSKGFQTAFSVKLLL